ncbi:MAG: YfhO family protein [Bacteroidetes bacterium]|nr:YfhO family protein [Bacteroidota bacterium]
MRLAQRAIAIGWVRDLAALSFILACVLVFFKDAMLFGNIYWEPDTVTYYYPATRQLDDALGRGFLQLWTPYIFAGFHLFADGESGALYPPKLIALLLLSADQAVIWSRVLRFFLAATFMYAFIRQLGLGRYGALVSGLVFSLGSFLVAQLHHTNLSNTAIWLPLVLLFADRAFQSMGFRRYASLSLAGVALGMASLGVHLQPVMLIIFALAWYAAFKAFSVPAAAVPWTGLRWQFSLPRVFPLSGWRSPAPRRGRWNAVFDLIGRCVAYTWPRAWFAGQVVGIVTAIGFALAAAQLIPLYELTRYSFRGYRLAYDFAVSFAASPHNLLTMVFPYFFRTAEGDPWSFWTYWETTTYIGIAPLALALLAVTFVRRRHVVFFGIFAVLTLLLAFGDYLPFKLYWLFWRIPGFSFLRAPGRFSFLFVFSMAVLVAFGAQWLVQSVRASGDTRDHRARRALTIFVSAFAAFSALLAAGAIWLRAWLLANHTDGVAFITANYMTFRRGNYLLDPEMAYRALVFNLDLYNPKTQVSLALLGTTLALLAGWICWPRGRRLWQASLLGLVAFDLLFFASNFHPLMPIEKLTVPPPAGKFLVDHNGLYRAYTWWPAEETDPNRLLPFRVAAAGGYSSLEPDRHRQLMSRIDKGSYRLLDLMGVRYIVAARDATGWQQRGYKRVFEDRDVRIYENPNYLPRAMLIPSLVIASSSRSILDWLADRQFDFTKIAVVEDTQAPYRDPHIKALSRPPLQWAAADTMPRPGKAEVTEYRSERVVVRVRAEKDSLLLLTDAYHNGWRAYVDGRPQRVYLTDYLFRGVYVPAGEHTVEFVFEPFSVRLGIAISLFTLVGLAMFWLIGYWRLRAGRPTQRPA